MSRFPSCALAVVAVAVVIACSDSTGPQTAQIAPGQTARFSGSGSGGGGGGGVVPIMPPACSLLSLTPKSGYTPQGFSYAAIWVNIKLKNCGTSPISVQAELRMDRTGQLPGSWSPTYLLPFAAPFSDSVLPWTAQPGDSLMIAVDFDFQSYSTSYTSFVNVKDFNTGALLATCSAVSVTPKPRGIGGSAGGGSNGSSDTACYK